MVETILTAVWLLAASFLDIRCRRIPVRLLIFGGMAVAAAVIWRCGGRPAEYWESLKGCVPGVTLIGMSALTGKVGAADGIAMLFLGLLVGESCLVIFVFSLLLISIYSGLLLVLRRAGRSTELPYLPFLTAAWLLEKILGV